MDYVMKNLFQLIKKTPKFFRLSSRDRALLIEAFLFTGLIRFKILFFHFYKLASYSGKHKEESPWEISHGEKIIVNEIGDAVNLVCKYTPWESKCLVKALTVQIMLKKRKIGSTIYLGVARDKKNKPIAHAWLRSGTDIITGGYEYKRFTEVAKFGSSIGVGK
jgi:hypothetical protein